MLFLLKILQLMEVFVATRYMLNILVVIASHGPYEIHISSETCLKEIIRYYLFSF